METPFLSISPAFRGTDPALASCVQSCPVSVYQAPAVSLFPSPWLPGTLDEESVLGSRRLSCFCQSVKVTLGTWMSLVFLFPEMSGSTLSSGFYKLVSPVVSAVCKALAAPVFSEAV